MSSDLDRSSQRNAVLAGFLGWMLDAFDFFIVTLVFTDLAKAFFDTSTPQLASHAREAMVFASSATLMMRPVGAIVLEIDLPEHRLPHDRLREFTRQSSAPGARLHNRDNRRHVQ